MISRPPSWMSEDELEEQLRDVLSQLRVRCAEYLSIPSNEIYQEDKSTKLDKMRTDFCRREVVNDIQHTRIYTIRKRLCQFVPYEREIIFLVWNCKTVIMRTSVSQTGFNIFNQILSVVNTPICLLVPRQTTRTGGICSIYKVLSYSFSGN
jgi:hypothetical protein